MQKKRVLTTLGLWTATLAMCMLVGGLPRPAHAVTMTFNGGSGEADSYTEHGMTVDAILFPDDRDHIHLGHGNGGGSADLWNNSAPCCSRLYGFTFGGTPFDLVSFDVVRISGGAVSSFTSASGAVVSLTRPGTPIGTFHLPSVGWSGITSFQWEQTDGHMAIDNLVFRPTSTATPTPEPSTMALFGTGLVGLLAYGWRRRTQVN